MKKKLPDKWGFPIHAGKRIHFSAWCFLFFILFSFPFSVHAVMQETVTLHMSSATLSKVLSEIKE